MMEMITAEPQVAERDGTDFLFLPFAAQKFAKKVSFLQFFEKRLTKGKIGSIIRTNKR